MKQKQLYAIYEIKYNRELGYQELERLNDVTFDNMNDALKVRDELQKNEHNSLVVHGHRCAGPGRLPRPLANRLAYINFLRDDVAGPGKSGLAKQYAKEHGLPTIELICEETDEIRGVLNAMGARPYKTPYFDPSPVAMTKTIKWDEANLDQPSAENLRFFSGTPLEEKLLKDNHELSNLKRVTKQFQKTWNVAADLVINQKIAEIQNRLEVDKLLDAEKLLPMLMGEKYCDEARFPESVTLTRDDLVKLRNNIMLSQETHVLDTAFERAKNKWLSANAQDNPTPTEIKIAEEIANFEVHDIEPSQWVLDWLEDPANELADLSDLTFCLLASRLPDNE